jgi:hypothetical protein
MMRVGDSEVRLCLLDTMAVSEMVKRPKGVFRHFLEWAMAPGAPVLPCFTPYTLIELRRKPTLFAQFIEQFHLFPCVLLRGYMEFIEDEAAHYPDPSDIDPCAVAFTPIGGPGNLLTNLPEMMRLSNFATWEREWNAARSEIVGGMVSLVRNYPPAGSKYTAEEVANFVWQASFSQLVYHVESFVKGTLDRSEVLEIDAFPAVKAMTYTVFHKFYADRDRKPGDSDAFDVLIASAFPYVEAVITEAHLADALRKTKHRDSFLEHLSVFTLRDFRNSHPAALARHA